MNKCNICENPEGGEYKCEVEGETFCKKCLEIEFNNMDFESYLDFYFIGLKEKIAKG